MKIGTRLGLGFACTLLLTVMMGVTSWVILQKIMQATDAMVSDGVQIERDVKDWLASTTLNGERAYILAMGFSGKQADAMRRNMAATSEHISTVQKRLESKEQDETEKRLLATIAQKRIFYVNIRKEVGDLNDQGKVVEAMEHTMTKMVPARDDYIAAIAEFTSYEQQHLIKANEEVERISQFAQYLTLGFAGVAVLLGLAVALRLTWGITGPLNEAVKVAKTVASGDLTSRIEVRTTDETGQLMQAMKDMNESLLNTVLQVRQSSDTIAMATSEIASGNLDLSSRTEQQAASLEETASSMEEITSTVRQTGDNARQANQLAAQAAEIATRGSDVASLVADTMREIEGSSKKIVDIISVIDGITFQTNILALNAAVEAARAGEQGRGFAVVATEVRSLAQRSAIAAREIKDLIDDSVDKVLHGTGLVNNAVSTMLEIGDSIRRVNDIVSEITMATQEQVQGIEQVNQAVAEMDTVSQQNAALVEEAAAAAESMQDQARALVSLVDVFNTGSGKARFPLAVMASPAAVPKRPAKDPVRQLKTPAMEVVSSRDDDWEEF